MSKEINDNVNEDRLEDTNTQTTDNGESVYEKFFGQKFQCETKTPERADILKDKGIELPIITKKSKMEHRQIDALERIHIKEERE